MRSPRATRSPDFFQHTTRRAIRPGDFGLNVISPHSVASVMTFCSLRMEADFAQYRKRRPAGAIFKAGDGADGGGAIDVHVPDSEEDGDALTGTAGVFFVGDDDDATIGRGDDCAGICGDDAFGVAEEVEDEDGEEEENYAGDRPAQEQGRQRPAREGAARSSSLP